MEGEFFNYCIADNEFRSLRREYDQLDAKVNLGHDLLRMLKNNDLRLPHREAAEEQEQLAAHMFFEGARKNETALNDLLSKMNALRYGQLMTAFVKFKMDEHDHCHKAEDDSLYCVLCNVDIEGKYYNGAYMAHAQTPSHVNKRNALLMFRTKMEALKHRRLDTACQMDKIDHCFEGTDGSLYCDLCNVDIEGTYEQHMQVPSLLAQDRLDEVKRIFDDIAK